MGIMVKMMHSVAVMDQRAWGSTQHDAGLPSEEHGLLISLKPRQEFPISCLGCFIVPYLIP